MDALKAAVEARKAAAAAAAAAVGSKYAKRGDVEARRRAAEAAEAEAAKRGRGGGGDDGRAGKRVKESAPSAPAPASDAALPPDEVKRRLRLLGEPATLFGESDADRGARLAAAAAAFRPADDAAGGGQQGNLMLTLEREERARRAREAALAAAAGERADAAASAAAPPAPPPPADGDAATAAAFAAAAAALAKARATGGGVAPSSSSAPAAPEDRIAAAVRGWMGAWAAELAARPPALAASAHGTHATLIHAQTAEYLKPLHRRLKRRTLDAELVAGLSLFVDAADGRNYLAAADVYTRLAIGNAPWPIGVTSVGIHERKAREKISNVAGGGGGGGGAAHIMNDEATRKYLQALKRVLTFLQRARPADPSRCVEFDGGGGDKAALLAASARGDAPLALPPPRALVDGRGEVVVPSKWGAVLRGTDVYREKVREAEEGGGKH